MSAAYQAVRENDLVEAAIEWLASRAPAEWSFARSNRPELTAGGRGGDAAIEVGAPGFAATVLVEAKPSLEPRDVAGLFGSVGQTLRALSPGFPVLVIAPWLSSRTRELLSAQGINYLDLTGNGRLRLDRPALFIETQGAERDPSPTPRGEVRVRGPKAARLIRFLLDVRPPYGVSELAKATGLTAGYVSPLLATLDREAVIQRSTRGGVESVDLEGLLRRWANDYDVFKSNRSASFLSPAGTAEALQRLKGVALDGLSALSGSFAAVRIAPVAAPALLMVYTRSIDAIAEPLKLLPADRGTNVVLLEPFDPVVWERTSYDDGVRYVAVSQVAVDCLTGNGRMPAEGEALLRWMTENEPSWRIDSIQSFADRFGDYTGA